MVDIFLLLENNIPTALQSILRGFRCSVFFPSEEEIGIPVDAPDELIIQEVAKQKEELGIDRIIVTRDKKFISHLHNEPIKIIIIHSYSSLKSGQVSLGQLAEDIVATAEKMVKETKGTAIEFIKC